SGCACCGVSRRQFLRAGCAACAGAAGLLSVPGWLGAAQDDGKTRIRIVYALHGETQTVPDWPNKGFDFRPVMERINTELAQRCPDFEFVASMANGAEQAKKILEADKSAAIDGYLVYQMNCWNQVVQTMAASGKPILYADFQFAGSGGFLVYTASFLRSHAPNVGFVASSRIEDLVEAVKCFGLVKKGGSLADFVNASRRVRLAQTPQAGNLKAVHPDWLKTLSPEECVKGMKQSRILAVNGQDSGPAAPIMEIPVERVSFAEVNEAWASADKDEARAIADKWENNAALIVGVNRETLEQSAAMYLAEKAVLRKHEANAITINCLGGFYGGHIHAYPCLGFHELNNEGLVGGCECDVRSAATMTAFTTLTQGRPGLISDPVLDTAKRQIIYAHCVASNRAFGPKGEANPFLIMTHSEDRQGASVRSLLPLGYMTTTMEIAPDRKEILMHRGITVANDPNDRACRTKLAAEPLGDFEKLFTAWDQWGWHRVTFYGDLKEPVTAVAELLGWKVVQEA
ncbi:MAG: twin-arginine translocation signal domain-containing protein, partial [Candidatus Omnitrophica bacterium]|nr:twin-arginine translocation signal domain-containing protein [Candidatus Omnitrophota bacterium]